MRCEDVRKHSADYLAGTLDDTIRRDVDLHLMECGSCRNELADMKRTWALLGGIPQEEPSSELTARFYDMLETEKEKTALHRDETSLPKPSENVVNWVVPKRALYQAAAAVIVLLFGFSSGVMFGKTGTNGVEVIALKEEMNEMRQLLTVALLGQGTTVDRLRGVTLSSQVSNADDRVIESLLKTMNADPNVNVRLAAVEAIRRYSDRPWVRAEAVESLAIQESPLVQISLIELLTDIGEKEAVTTFEELIEDEKTMEPVRKRARMGIERII